MANLAVIETSACNSHFAYLLTTVAMAKRLAPSRSKLLRVRFDDFVRSEMVTFLNILSDRAE